MATLAELLRDRAVVPGPVVEHLQRLVGILGDPFRPVVFRPFAVRAHCRRDRGLRGRWPGEADHQPDAPSGGPARPRGERRRAAATGPGLVARERRRGGSAGRRQERAGPGRLHTGTLRRRSRSGAHPRGAPGSRPAGRASSSASMWAFSTALRGWWQPARSRSRWTSRSRARRRVSAMA